MSSTKVHLPPFGHGSGKVRWVRKVGDVLKHGEHLLDVDFGAARIPFPSPFTGKLVDLKVQEGNDAHGDTVVCEIDVEPEKEAPLEPIDICATCGARRGENATSCARCGTAHAATTLRVPRESNARWASISCAFKCRMCGFVVPLNHINVDGAVTCARCSLEQAWNPQVWSDAFEYAHDVADDMIKEKTIVHKFTVRSENMLEITASDGHPLCEKCHGVLDFEIASGGKGVAKCAACASSISLEIPDDLLRMTNGALRLAMTAAHRSTELESRVEDVAGTLAIHCPSCGAPLTPGASKLTHCKFCDTTSRIPDRVQFKMNGTLPKAEPIWLAFRGPSPARRERDKKVTDQTKEAFLRRFRDAGGAALVQQHQQEHDRQHRKEQARELAQQKQKDDVKTKSEKRDRTAFIVIAVFFALVFGGLAIYKEFFRD